MIDRRAVVERHLVTVHGIEPRSPLSVGNGELCFTADVTGLQSLAEAYPLREARGGRDGSLLCTQSQWGWHTIPTADGSLPEPARRTYLTRRGPVSYIDLDGELEPAAGAAGGGEHWLRANPHRIDLARVGLCLAERRGAGGALPRSLSVREIGSPLQQLDVWSGILTSRFVLGGCAVEVLTACHPHRDVLAVRIRSQALEQMGLAVAIEFAYGSASWNDAADWTRPEAHETVVNWLGGRGSGLGTGRELLVERRLDATRYAVRIAAATEVSAATPRPHLLVLYGRSAELELTLEFLPLSAPATGSAAEPLPGVDEVAGASRRHWASFWASGAALDLAGCSHPKAPELERRVVLSQYLTAINCAGSLPPQETGLSGNSWHGRFHLEMQWWHLAHFALWGRPALLEPAMGWFCEHLGAAREIARGQGYRGARWPKQVGPEGLESPSPIGPFLVWQQPHPIYLAELLRREDPGRATLERYAAVVLESAQFMVDFAEATPEGYALGPPLVPAQECYAELRATTANPTFELAYWGWAIDVAERWRQLLGLADEPAWRDVAAALARPLVRDGRYAAVGTPPYLLRRDHPSMLLALGLLPRTAAVDAAVMGATLDDVLASWDWSSAWGWDFPALAMTATRLGRAGDAVAALSMDTPKNAFQRNGHNRQSPVLPQYLPGNGALLAAVALMAGGFDGAPRPAPGFPSDGSWQVEHEGFRAAP
ncbi:MAG TPA: hypothetical protein VMD59_11175 [Acidimicrobiales bacterium]|nr:hypothetical protein [Acidimicrobiales bacterium]